MKGYRWNHKRVYRIYRELELNLRIKSRKRNVREKTEPLAVPAATNQCWSMDFMHDQLADGRIQIAGNLLAPKITIDRQNYRLIRLLDDGLYADCILCTDSDCFDFLHIFG